MFYASKSMQIYKWKHQIVSKIFIILLLVGRARWEHVHKICAIKVVAVLFIYYYYYYLSPSLARVLLRSDRFWICCAVACMHTNAWNCERDSLLWGGRNVWFKWSNSESYAVSVSINSNNRMWKNIEMIELCDQRLPSSRKWNRISTLKMIPLNAHTLFAINPSFHHLHSIVRFIIISTANRTVRTSHIHPIQQNKEVFAMSANAKIHFYRIWMET